MITVEEEEAINKDCNYFGTQNYCYRSPEGIKYLWPAAIVAQLRGVVYSFQDNNFAAQVSDQAIQEEAIADLTIHWGFETAGIYLDCLEELGSKILIPEEREAWLNKE